jgi:hypothetical protein
MTRLHPVPTWVQKANRRVRRAVWVYACSTFGLWMVSVVLLVGLADYLLRSEDPGIRLISTGLVLAVAAWSFHRHLRPGWVYRPSDLQIAQWIEQRYPQLQNRLSSGLAFVNQSEQDPSAGSVDLRRAVVAQATGDLESLDIRSCVDVRPSWRTAVMAGVVSLLALALVLLDPASSGLAARRLVMPWQPASWPRRHQLVFVDPPERLAAGSDFEVTVIDGRGDLPDVVRIYYWFDGTLEAEIQTKPMSPLDDRMVYRWENVQRSFRYRASGGDDTTMAWRHLEVIETPQVEQLRLQLHPPAYTGWPVESSGENVVALEGTAIGASGRLDKPVAAVELQVVPEQQQEPRGWTARVGDDGLTFSLPADHPAPWVAENSGHYWFKVTDPQGLRGRGSRPWNLRVVPDAAPVVTLEKPGPNTFVTATAIVPIQATVKDDLAIRAIVVRYRRGDQAEDARQSFEVYRGPDQAPSASSGGLGAAGDRGETRTVETPWDLSRIAGLTPGTWIELQMVAEDYKPQSGQSSPRRLTIISPEELDERLAARQAYLLGQLREILRMQQESRARVKSLQIGLEATGALDRQDVDQLQSVELNQRQIGRNLDDPADGVAAQITAVLDELATNRVDQPETMRRMTELLAAVRHIGQQHLPEIQRHLIRSLRLARGVARSENDSPDSPADADPLRDSLASVGSRQDQVIAILEDLLGELAQWDDYRRFAREISRIQREQQALTDQTDQLRLDTLGQRPEDLSPQNRAALNRQAERQSELARRLDKTLSRMEQMRKELAETEPLAAEILADALHLARQAAISGQMRESGQQIEANQVGQAVDTQRRVESHLAELSDVLANRREQELDRRLQGLQQADAQLQRLRQNLQTLRQQLQQNQQVPDPEVRERDLQQLAQQAEDLAEQATRLGRRLQRLQAEETAELLDRAASHLHQSAQAGQQGLAPETIEQAQQADQALQQAQEQLDAQRQQAAQDLFQEMMARLQQQIGSLATRQQGLLEATSELHSLRRDAESPFTEAQLASLRDLARAQHTLGEETLNLTAHALQSRVFAEGLRGAATEMQHAAHGLDQQQTGTPTERHQRHAIARLKHLIQALERDEPSDEPTEEAVQSDEDPPDQQGEDAIQRLAELKLLRLLQIEVNQQTAELGELLERGAQRPETLWNRLQELAVEQGRLADMILDMVQ